MIAQNTLENYLFGAADMLRGHIDAADFKQYIFPLVFYKRLCDVWDEEYDKGFFFLHERKISKEEEVSQEDDEYIKNTYPHQFKIPKEFHFEEVKGTSKNVGHKLSQSFVGIENENPSLRGIFGTFGDTQWTNAQKFSDATIKELLEHFGKLALNTKNVPADMMGGGYEYLIKKFADDGGHTAAEFYTNRTVVRLMTMLCEPQPKESVYDPTCGSGGMLLECVQYLKKERHEQYNSLRLYGQEKNIITSVIAKINMMLHGINEFHIIQGDTLEDPKFIENDHLKKYDICLANPPYSIKKWNQKAFKSDSWGRNKYGTPPQGCADYAFQQHILASLTEQGRCAVLWPHGVLFRDSEADIRKKMLADDWIEAIIGMGGNLFYNSSMESCIVLCRKNKPKERKNKVIFINAVKEIEKIRATANLRPEHIDKIYQTFKNFEDVAGFAKVVTNTEILQNNGNLSIPLYVIPIENTEKIPLKTLFDKLQKSKTIFDADFENLMQKLQNAEINF